MLNRPTNSQPQITRNFKLQHGITLIESLVAIVVVALGILGILGVQMRTLNDTQTSVRRAQAVRLIEDLSERMKINPNALANLNGYVTDWDATPASLKDCSASTCTNAELAGYDLAQWKQTVKNTLPIADAKIFIAQGEATASNRRQLGIMIRWRENERNTSSSYKDDIDATKVRAADNTLSAGAGGAAACADNYTCHLQYLSVSARCAPYLADATVQFFCPASQAKS